MKAPESGGEANSIAQPFVESVSSGQDQREHLLTDGKSTDEPAAPQGSGPATDKPAARPQKTGSDKTAEPASKPAAPPPRPQTTESAPPTVPTAAPASATPAPPAGAGKTGPQPQNSPAQATPAQATSAQATSAQATPARPSPAQEVAAGAQKTAPPSGQTPDSPARPQEAGGIRNSGQPLPEESLEELERRRIVFKHRTEKPTDVGKIVTWIAGGIFLLLVAILMLSMNSI